MQAKFPIMPESLMQMQISQLSWECASHSLGDKHGLKEVL